MKPGRNDFCPCGSGRKYKLCCIARGKAETRHESLHSKGVIAKQAGNLQVAIDPTSSSNPAYYNELGRVLEEQGRLDDAINSYCKALSLKLDYVDALCNLGSALQKQGNNVEAAASYRTALLFKPDRAETHNELGRALRIQGKIDEAVASYRQALLLKPDYVEAHNNLGNALLQQGKVDEAVLSYRQALSLRPGYAVTHANLGNALRSQGKLNEAIASYRKALSFEPGFAEAHNNLGTALEENGEPAAAVASYRKALALRPNYVAAYSNLIYSHAFTNDISQESLCVLARGWEKAVLNESERAAARTRRFSCAPRVGRKLNIGVVSAEIGQHAVAEFLQPFLENLDRERSSLILYPTVIRPEPRALRICQLADSVRVLAGLSDSMAADQIRRDGIDILLDTTGHTRDCRLGIFAHRAAPVQCTYIGFWATTGLTEMDCFITDQHFPSACESHFSERLWRLPRLSSLSYNGDTSLPDSHWKPRRDGTIWLGSFNRFSKIREECLALWARVLKAIPGSKLLLEDHAAFDQDAHERISDGLSRYGVDQERVEFYPYVPGHVRHMVLYDQLDIALDTIPFNSGTTACDALWMGVPLVAMHGNWSGGRIASTFLRAMGRPEWIARDEDEYVAIVAALAQDVAGRERLRKSQREMMAASPLCDAKRLALDLGDAFEAMFDQWWVTR